MTGIPAIAAAGIATFPPPRRRPAEVLRALAGLLQDRGLTRLYGSACTMLGVLSVAYGVTVWTDGQRLWWRGRDDETIWPAADPEGAADQLAHLVASTGIPEDGGSPGPG